VLSGEIQEDGVSDPLGEIRERLDAIDTALVDALAARQRLVLDVARLKERDGTRLRDLPREEELLSRLVVRAREAGPRWLLRHAPVPRDPEPFDAEAGGRAACRRPASGAAPIRVGYQGGDGAYSQIAARRHFGARDGEATYRGHASFEQMLDAVQSGALDYAVLPIENTTSGSVDPSYDLLTRMDLAIVGEEIQEVDHCLLAIEEVPLSRIRRIYSHPVALSQCGRFLATLEDCHVEAFVDTALAARKVRDEQDLSQAAIASEEAGRLYGLSVPRGVADQRENYTRMVIVATKPVAHDLRSLARPRCRSRRATSGRCCAV
jgi:chorismate mutase/prephenate dehydratase